MKTTKRILIPHTPKVLAGSPDGDYFREALVFAQESQKEQQLIFAWEKNIAAVQIGWWKEFGRASGGVVLPRQYGFPLLTSVRIINKAFSFWMAYYLWDWFCLCYERKRLIVGKYIENHVVAIEFEKKENKP